MANLGMTEEEVKAYVKRRLGDGVVGVELTDAHMDDVLRATKRWFVARCAIKTVSTLTVSTDVSEYQLDNQIVDVYEVYFPNNNLTSFDKSDDFSYVNGFYLGSFFGGELSEGYRFNQMPYSDLVQRLQYLETAQRIWGADAQWEYESRTRTLRIMPSPPVAGTAVIIGNNANVDTTSLDPLDEDLFLRWATAEAKDMLGQIRSKYDTVPTAGGDRALNGDALLGQALEEKELLEKQLLERKMPTYIILG